MSSTFPCLDEQRRYHSFPCSQCTAPSCWMGKKPKKAVVLPDGYRACLHCEQPFGSRYRTLYCSDTCNKAAHMQRRRNRVAARNG
jgi:hypothetical protein